MQQELTTVVAGRPWLVPVRYDAENDREAWLADRISGIGGSDAAAIVGEHPQKSAADVWQERVTGIISTLDNERSEVGRLLEPTILAWYEQGAPQWPRAGNALYIAKPPTVYHRDRPWQRGSADGLAYYPEAVATFLARGESPAFTAALPDHLVEIKTHGWFASRSYGTHEDGTPIDVPHEKRIQCAWYMALYDVPVAMLLALVDTHLRKTYVIERDRELEDSLLEQVDYFWRHHILTGEPPPPDGTESYRTYVKERFKKHGAELVPTTPEVDDTIRRLMRLKRLEKRIERERERVEQVIKTHIGENEGISTQLGKVTWKNQRSGKLHEKEARAELYSVAGWTDLEIRDFERRHATPEHRVLRTPSL